MSCVCEVLDNPTRSGIPGVIALLKDSENPVAVGIDYIQACPVCKTYATHLEAAFAYYSLSAPSRMPQIEPEDFLSEQEIKFLIDLYKAQPFPTERLPYTNVFEAMVRWLNEFRQNEIRRREPVSNYTVYALLTALRKDKLLPLKRKG